MTTLPTTSENNIQTIQREMTITHDDFFRLLPKALKNRNYTISENGIVVELDAGQLKITLSSQVERTIGSLVLPLSCINFTFENCPEEIRTGFFEDFDLAFQKGGG